MYISKSPNIKHRYSSILYKPRLPTGPANVFIFWMNIQTGGCVYTETGYSDEFSSADKNWFATVKTGPKNKVLRRKN